jgi:hypothetical protein
MSIEPNLYIDGDGVNINMKNGIVESGNILLNSIQIALFTDPDNIEHHNLLLKRNNEKIGSKFFKACRLPVNLQGLLDRTTAAKSDLGYLKDSGIASDYDVKVISTENGNIQITITIQIKNKEFISYTFVGSGVEYRLK